jgi:hypothetical protein
VDPSETYIDYQLGLRSACNAHETRFTSGYVAHDSCRVASYVTGAYHGRTAFASMVRLHSCPFQTLIIETPYNL